MRTWAATEEYRIGRVDAQAPDLFSEVAAFSMGPDGDLYVIDTSTQEVRVFAGDSGTWLRSFGGRGEGPGELRDAAGMTWDAVGRLWVNDPGQSRFTGFAADGSVLSTHLRVVRGNFFPWQGRILPEYGMVDWDVDLVRPSRGGAATATVLTALALGPDMTRLDTLDQLIIPRFVTSDGKQRFPFAGVRVLHLDTEGMVWVANPHTYQVSRGPLGGKRVPVITLDITPARVTEAEVTELRARLEGRVPPMIQAEWETVFAEMPEEKAAIRALFTADGGRVFVMPDLDGVEFGTILDVFTRDGQHQGRIRLPVAVEANPPPAITGNALFALVLDSLDVPSLARFDISEPR